MAQCYNVGCNSFQKWFAGNVLRKMMLTDTDIFKKVGNNIYPIVAPEGVNGDFITYAREKYTKSITKMGVYEDVCKVSIVAISDKYDSSVELASLIDNCLTGPHTLDDGTRLKIDLTDSTESFEDSKYFQVLIFEIK